MINSSHHTQINSSHHTQINSFSSYSTVIERLYQTILRQRDADPQTSYTAFLFQQAPTKIAQNAR